jgi:hypothetical protein
MGPSRIGYFPPDTGRLNSEMNAHQAWCPLSCGSRAGYLNGECDMIITLGIAEQPGRR